MYSLSTDRRDVLVGTPCLFMNDRQIPNAAWEGFVVKKNGTRLTIHIPNYRSGGSGPWKLPSDKNMFEFSWRKSKRIWSQVGDGAPRDDCSLLFYDEKREDREKKMYESIRDLRLEEKKHETK